MIDGNKRIGTHAMLVFLALNGIELKYTQKELYETIPDGQQVDYMYGEALYKPEMKEEYHILICKMRLGKPVQANGGLSYRDLGIWQEHLFLRIMPKSVILSSQHREAETVGGLPSRRSFLYTLKSKGN